MGKQIGKKQSLMMGFLDLRKSKEFSMRGERVAMD